MAPTLTAAQKAAAAVAAAQAAEVVVLQSRLASLYAIRDGGIEKRKIGDALELTYRSAADVLAAISDLERRLGVRNVTRTSLVVHSHKGWNRRRDW